MSNGQQPLHRRLREALESLGISALVAMIVSTGVGTYFTIRVENSKERVASLVYIQQQLDSSQNAIITQLGVYNTELLLNHKSDSSKKDELLKAIISAELNLNGLRNRIGDKPAVDQYGHELESLAVALRGVNTASDLKPVFVSAQKLLELHDQLSKGVHSDLDITLF